MKLQEIIETLSLKAAAREAGLEFRMVGGRVELTPTDPDDPRYSTDFILPSMRMVEACRADDFDFFLDLAEAVRQRYDIHISVASILEDLDTPPQKDRCIDLLDFLRESLATD